ncbi:MAG: alcohol acetyltransferase, partial [Clostridiales bacterium]
MGNDPKAWLKLDNAAKLYPATMRRDWMAMFRCSAHLTEQVDPVLLKQALACTVPRFPGFAVHLRRGLFWFYLEHSDELPEIQEDVKNPCVRMNLRENKQFMFRVRYYGNRIAVEVFHVLSDGMGGLCFLKTLLAEYLRLKYGVSIPRDAQILDCGEKPQSQELEDAFLKYASVEKLSRKEADAYYIRGQQEPMQITHITTGMIPVAQVLMRAKEKGVTLTEYLTSVLILSTDTMQRRM